MRCKEHEALDEAVQQALAERVAAEEALGDRTIEFPRRELGFIHAAMIWYEAVLARVRHAEQCGICRA